MIQCKHFVQTYELSNIICSYFSCLTTYPTPVHERNLKFRWWVPLKNSVKLAIWATYTRKKIGTKLCWIFFFLIQLLLFFINIVIDLSVCTLNYNVIKLSSSFFLSVQYIDLKCFYFIIYTQQLIRICHNILAFHFNSSNQFDLFSLLFFIKQCEL